jgi:hypothetical protein
MATALQTTPAWVHLLLASSFFLILSGSEAAAFRQAVKAAPQPVSEWYNLITPR